MRIIRYVAILLIVFGCWRGRDVAAQKTVAANEPADLVVLGGKIITLAGAAADGADVAEALAVRDGRILLAGANAEIERLIGPQTEVIRLTGQSVAPGFIETHCHSVGVARDSLVNTYAELSSIGEIQDWIRKRAQQIPAGQWIEVPRNEITRLTERRHPTPTELDAACQTHPVLCTSALKHVLNTRGWEALGVTGPESAIADGEVVRDESGQPLLLRGGSQAIRRRLPQPQPSRAETMPALERVLHGYNQVGVTSIFERATDPDNLGLFRELHDRGRLTVRVTGTFRFSARTAEQVEQFLGQLNLKPGEGNEWVKAGPLKVTVDGGIHWGTTRLSEPYGAERARFYRLDDASYRGELFYDVATMKEIFAAATRRGWQFSAHVTGDEGAQRVLDAVAAVAADNPEMLKRRFTLIHAYFPTPEIVRRAHELGVCVDTQGYLYYKDSDAMADIYGPPWAERFIGLGDWVRGGVPVAINSDHMIGLDADHAMNSFNPLLMLWIAVARRSTGGHVYGPQQKLSRLDALRCITQWAAYLSFDEDKLGTLAPGKLADFVVLDRDYLTCPEAEIREIRALRTVIGGQTVYDHQKD